MDTESEQGVLGKIDIDSSLSFQLLAYSHIYFVNVHLFSQTAQDRENANKLLAVLSHGCNTGDDLRYDRKIGIIDAQYNTAGNAALSASRN